MRNNLVAHVIQMAELPVPHKNRLVHAENKERHVRTASQCRKMCAQIVIMSQILFQTNI